MSTPAFFKSFDNITAAPASYGTESADHFASFGFSTKGGGVRIRHVSGGVGPVFFSFTGQADHGSIAAGAADLVFDGIRADRIYLKGGTGVEVVEVYAWSDL